MSSLDGSLDIVFENSHFVIVDKPAGMLSVPSRQGAKDPRPVVGLLLQKQLKAKIFPCHRLDLEVAGLLLFAKSAEAHKAANRWFEKHEVQKTYHALAEGDAARAENFRQTTEWQCRLVRGKKRAFEAEYGDPAQTLVTYLGLREDKLFFQLSPLTGRSHQLRYEMYRHQFPICGDTLYGAKKPFDKLQSQAGIALKATVLDFSKSQKRESFGLPEKIEITF